MAYRETDKVRSRKRDTRDAILSAARAHIARGGYQAAQMQAVAASAGFATGTVYRYFDSKAALFAQVFERVAQHEVDVVEATAARAGTCRERLERTLHTFMARALRAPRLAYALLAEPVDPLVESECLVFRRAYARVFTNLLREGIADGSFAAQEPDLAAAALVGVLNETLVGPLSPELTASRAGEPSSDTELINAITAVCLRAVTSSSTTTERA